MTTRYVVNKANLHPDKPIPERHTQTFHVVLATDYERLQSALKALDRAYVNLIEAARDRIVSLGGTCDPVDVMERADPALRAARSYGEKP
jgi:hypothetical protein